MPVKNKRCYGHQWRTSSSTQESRGTVRFIGKVHRPRKVSTVWINQADAWAASIEKEGPMPRFVEAPAEEDEDDD